MSSSLVAVVMGLLTLAAQSSPAQQEDSLRSGLRDGRSDSIASPASHPPTALMLTLKSIARAAGGAGFLSTAGFLVDDVYCEKHHGDEQGFIFGPCAFYAGDGTAIGWFGGALVGATATAAHLARKRGCPRPNAIARALAGAVPGVLPGLFIVSQRTGNYPPSRSVFIFTAPLLAGAGAAAAVIGCHG